MTETFLIPQDNIAALEERIAKLNKRAEKIGVEPITVTKGETQIESTDEGQREVVPVEVAGKAPIIDGWAFIATLEHDEDGTVIRRIPTFREDEFDLTPYRTATPDNCDHCGYKRRRNDTYIVGFTERQRMTDPQPVGTTKQVGSNCLKDFTGHESPHLIAKQMEMVRDLLDELRGGSYGEGGFVPRYSAVDYLAFVAWVMRKDGWVSKRQAWEQGGTATAVRAADGFMRMSEFSQRPSEDDYALAAKTVEWAEALSEDDLDNDYLWNLHTVLKNDSLTERQFGIAASGIQAYKRNAQDAAKVSEFAGEVGERIEVTFTVQQSFDNIEYTTYLLRDDKGRSLKWSTQKVLDPASTYTGSFKVKAHNEHNRYGKQTLINYPRDLERVSA